MTLRKKIITGAIALTVGMTAMVPTQVRAADYDWHHQEHHDHEAWRAHHDHDRDWRDRDHDRDRDYSVNRNGYIPPNGQGMINSRNPNFYWTCDSDGHHCRWARR